MKILLLHPEDELEKGPWANLRWDRIIDLGLGGRKTYERWQRQFRCPAITLDSLRNGFDDFYRVRDILGLGCGRFIDRYGLDWWEIMSILLHGELEALVILRRFSQTLGSSDEVHVSRPCLHANLLQCLLPQATRVFPLPRRAQKSGLRHYLRASSKLSTLQMVDVFWDKYDAGYQFRGRLARKRIPFAHPVVLLPSAYVNVSRTQIAYANTFPEENFLLVTTRQSGWISNPPKNVSAAWLSSYASVRDRSRENVEMENDWQVLLGDLRKVEEFEILDRLKYLDIFSQRFRRGFEVRDAWRNVLDDEPVEAVLSADDSNPYTRIPLLLAKARGLVNIACHHGALDCRYLFKRSYGDVVWVKGKMEEDYLVRRCRVPGERVEIGAPALPASWNGREILGPMSPRPHILFISEALDVGYGRAEEFYRDIVPPLADMAIGAGCQLIVKLHPAESKAQRTGIVSRILSGAQKKVTQIVEGPLTEELLASTWFGVTILSTVAMECAIRGIPCFLCKWLEAWPYGYIEQFTRFGIGISLNEPTEISRIPQYLKRHEVSKEVMNNCWRPAEPGRLRELIESYKKTCTAVAR